VKSASSNRQQPARTAVVGYRTARWLVEFDVAGDGWGPSLFRGVDGFGRGDFAGAFDMLLDVGKQVWDSLPRHIGIATCVRAAIGGLALTCALSFPLSRNGSVYLSAAPGQPKTSQTPAAGSVSPQGAPGLSAATAAAPQAAQRQTQSIVVLDPAHGGADYGARGTGGIRESEIVLQFAAQVRTALEANGFLVMQTRQGNENPSFDDRSAIANAQRGAVFVSLHIASTGLPGTVRVYVMSDLPAANEATGLIPWDRAQAPFVPLSRRFGDMVQGFLTQRFKGSPNTAQAAAVRQLRTTAAPAIAVEVSSVSVEDRNQLDRMAPGVADAIARGASGFRPLYVVAAVNPGDRP
jgi:N-acetylmuramoyl-L-alanine amidase